MEVWVVTGIVVVVLAAVWFIEYRFRRPDQIVLREKKGSVEENTNRWYPRHMSLALPGSVYAVQSQVDTEARGKLGIRVVLDLAVAPSRNHLQALVRAGGWSSDVVIHATRELERRTHALIREFAEQKDIDALQPEVLKKQLVKQVSDGSLLLGLELDNLHIQSIEPLDKRITEAMQRREADRILEETEKISQQARISAEKARIDAESEIADREHVLRLKKLDLSGKEQAKEAVLAEVRVREEQKRRLMQIDTETKEMDLLKKNPEMILLSPQLAQLAEASQQLRNARTVVNLQGQDGTAVGFLNDLIQDIIKRLQIKEK
jgi:hypothetical protein